MKKLRDDVSIGEFNEMGQEYLPGALGLEMLELEEGSLKSRMPVRKLHFAPNEFLHAASVVALADTTCGYATIAHLPPGAPEFDSYARKCLFLLERTFKNATTAAPTAPAPLVFLSPMHEAPRFAPC